MHILHIISGKSFGFDATGMLPLTYAYKSLLPKELYGYCMNNPPSLPKVDYDYVMNIGLSLSKNYCGY